MGTKTTEKIKKMTRGDIFKVKYYPFRFRDDTTYINVFIGLKEENKHSSFVYKTEEENLSSVNVIIRQIYPYDPDAAELAPIDDKDAVELL